MGDGGRPVGRRLWAVSPEPAHVANAGEDAGEHGRLQDVAGELTLARRAPDRRVDDVVRGLELTLMALQRGHPAAAAEIIQTAALPELRGIAAQLRGA